MNIHSAPPTDPDAFLRWNEGREGKRELVNGKVVEMMVLVTRNHARTVARLLTLLTSRLDPSRFEAYASDIGIKTPTGVRFPDVVVDTVGGDGKDLAVRAPVFVCEVLSASSVKIDLVEKLAEYTATPSVEPYLVLSQDAPRAWLWTRAGESWRDEEFTEPRSVVSLKALGIEFPLSALYPQAQA